MPCTLALAVYDFLVCGCITYFQKCVSHIGSDTSLRAYFGISRLIDRKFKSSIDIMSVACLSQNAHVFFVTTVLSISLAVAFAAIAATIPSRHRVSYALNFSSWVITFRKIRKKKKKEEDRITTRSLGGALIPGPLPYQGNALPGFADAEVGKAVIRIYSNDS
jgi:hypothetical protein